MKGADCSTDYIHYTDCFPVLRQVFGFCNQTESVLLAGQTKDLTQFNSCPHVTGHVMWPLWWTEWHWGRFSSECFHFSLVSVIPPMLHTHHLLHMILARRTKGRRAGNLSKINPFFLYNSGSSGDINNTLPFFLPRVFNVLMKCVPFIMKGSIVTYRVTCKTLFPSCRILFRYSDTRIW